MSRIWRRLVRELPTGWCAQSAIRLGGPDDEQSSSSGHFFILYKLLLLRYSLLVMPIIKSAIKRNKQAQLRRQRNLVVKQAVKTDVRAVQAALSTGDKKKVDSALRAAFSEIDRAVKKGTLHANTAARKKSRLNATAKLAMAAKPAKTEAKTEAKATKPAAKKTPAKKPTTKK